LNASPVFRGLFRRLCHAFKASTPESNQGGVVTHSAYNLPPKLKMLPQAILRAQGERSPESLRFVSLAGAPSKENVSPEIADDGLPWPEPPGLVFSDSVPYAWK
jgi:hypothetical protein